jgi:hypothetical protein
MRKLFPILILTLAGCSTYDYKDCGVFYEMPGNVPTTRHAIPLAINNWGDAMTIARGIPPSRFFENNACMLTGEIND